MYALVISLQLQNPIDDFMWKKILLLFAVCLCIGVGLLYWIFLKNNIQGKEQVIYIRNGMTLEQLNDSLLIKGTLVQPWTFQQAARWMKFSKLKPGRYVLNAGMSNRAMINKLKGGVQDPVVFVIHNKRKVENIAGWCGMQFESDSVAFYQTFYDPVLMDSLKIPQDELMSYFIPNTYHVNWNTAPKKFLFRMIDEHAKFWTAERLEKAKNLGLKPAEVYTLASIVERETQFNPEKPRIAGVYLNRLKKAMKLQADPTAVFAANAFGVRRVTNDIIGYNSPYNTYLHTGLPPGPIYMSGIPSIDAVLNAELHNYLFFCAKADGSNTHAFAETSQQHMQNAREFWSMLDRQGIKE